MARIQHSMKPLRKGQSYKPIPPLQLLPTSSEPTRPKAVSPAALARAMTGRH